MYFKIAKMRIFGIELSQNFEYMLTLPGFGKVLTLVFGLVTLTLGASSYEDELDIWKEVVFIVAVIFCMGISLIYLAAHCFSDQLVMNKRNRLIDFLFHIVACIFYIVSGALLIDSAVDIQNSSNCKITAIYEYCKFFEEKLGAGIFGILTGLTYTFTASAIALVKNL